MFCPNCGTKNLETATTCTKCGFNIKGAAAPKFKGTMLMMNQPAAAKTPAPPAPAAPPAAAPAPEGSAAPAARPARPHFRGTIVGVAPPGGFGAIGSASAPAAAAPGAGYGPTVPAPAQTGAPPPPGFPAPGAGGYVPPAQPRGFGSPGPPGGVNPLGGTVAFDPMGQGFTSAPAGSPGAVAQGHGAPPPGYGATTASGGHGAPPPQGRYAAPAPAGGYGAAPGGYGAPQPGTQGGYGAPQAGYAAPVGYPQQAGASMVQAGGALASGNYGQPALAGKGPIRNPVMVTLLTVVTCGIYGIFAIYSMMSELKGYLNKQEIVPWQILVPVLNFVIVVGKLPEWVTEAKRRAGSRNPQSSGPILYFFLLPYFLTKDMNEVWDPTGVLS